MLHGHPPRYLIGCIAACIALALPAGVLAASGSLTISGAAPGNFTGTLTGSDQSLYTTLGTYTASDTTGTGKGWHITFQATRFACTSTDTGCPSAGDTFPASSLLMPAPKVTCASGTSCSGTAAPPTIKISTNTALDSGSAVTVASAALSTGEGTYNFTPGTIGTGNLQLTVPSYAYATTYHSTLTVSIVSGP